MSIVDHLIGYISGESFIKTFKMALFHQENGYEGLEPALRTTIEEFLATPNLPDPSKVSEGRKYLFRCSEKVASLFWHYAADFLDTTPIPSHLSGFRFYGIWLTSPSFEEDHTVDQISLREFSLSFPHKLNNVEFFTHEEELEFFRQQEKARIRGEVLEHPHVAKVEAWNSFQEEVSQVFAEEFSLEGSNHFTLDSNTDEYVIHRNGDPEWEGTLGELYYDRIDPVTQLDLDKSMFVSNVIVKVVLPSCVTPELAAPCLRYSVRKKLAEILPIVRDSLDEPKEES